MALACALAHAPTLPAQGPGPRAQGPSALHLLVVTGAGGEPRYADAFHESGAAIVEAAVERFGAAKEDVVLLGERPERAPGVVKGKSSKANVTAELARLASRSKAGDRVLVVLVGHGSHQGGVTRFNIPGPDLTDRELAAALDALEGRTVGVVVATSASGEMVKTLSGPGRVVVTATKSGFEGNESIFARHFARAWTGEGADVDKDGRVSLLEAFDFARREVAREYERDGRLLTEHAVLDDDGDGVGTAAPDGRSGDGALARRLHFAAAPAPAAGDTATARLRAERGDLEARLTALRARKDTMAETAYERELEQLLLAIARNGRELREREGAAGGTP
ncbi:MAG TPA: hypothetical protein VFZ11_01865 [Gemmatimonadaceae bacterium]